MMPRNHTQHIMALQEFIYAHTGCIKREIESKVKDVHVEIIGRGWR